MKLLDVIRVVIDESVGTRGALDNCRRELDRPYEDDRAVRDLRTRLDEPSVPGSAEPEPARHHRPAS